MFRALRVGPRIDVAWRIAAPVLAALLVLAAGTMPATGAADGPGGPVASLRARQKAAEADMRRADHQIQRLERQRKHQPRLLRAAKRDLGRAIVRRNAADRKADQARGRLGELRIELGREIRVHPHPNGKPKADKPKLRLRVVEASARTQRLSRQARVAERTVERARAVKQSRWQKPTRARIAARRAERERAEDRLDAAIDQMVALSKARAGRFGTAAVSSFRRPVRGSISQGYGCTGKATNPRRGGCRHFHDGIDVAAPRGARVRAAAPGFVSYVGFSPWDGRARAFIVIVGHAGGYHSVYAHLQPRDRVRAGQLVKRGQVIGRVGLTGRTTGPHVHLEVWRAGLTLDPRRAGR
jgi:murein DD-endopeptidase MepM/ murein hydrolase activator NlpD